MRIAPVAVAAVALMAATAIAVRAGIDDQALGDKDGTARHRSAPVHRVLPTTPQSYLGIYAPQVPRSYNKVSSFTHQTGVVPRIVMYYSSWLEPFQSNFGLLAARHGAIPLIQIEPSGVSLAAIAAGVYDGYLASYAAAVRGYGNAVILSFGHEMNGNWYTWGYRRTKPAEFVAAWKHIVTFFRAAGADNVTWLWTVNIVSDLPGSARIPGPAAWWPGSPYVTWVGIDGYYGQKTWKFNSLFGPTIAMVKELTSAPILIAETGASQAGQPAQIADLADGVRRFGLLGFVWFDSVGNSDWRIRTPAAIGALRTAARSYPGQGS